MPPVNRRDRHPPPPLCEVGVPASYDMDLSRRRAASVANALVSQFGIAADRLKAVGVGPVSPVASNRTEAGQALNRRVELVDK